MKLAEAFIGVPMERENGAPLPGQTLPRRVEIADARADEQRRVVVLSRETIMIGRSVAGVFMTLNVKASDFRGVSLRLRRPDNAELSGAGLVYELHLVHGDPDLCVLLGQADDDLDIQAEWRLWARFLRLPLLAERTLGEDEPARPMLGAVAALMPAPRRRGKFITARRARFLVRRKMGNAKASAQRFAPRLMIPGAGHDR